jgi:molecular chaperone GrpE
MKHKGKEKAKEAEATNDELEELRRQLSDLQKEKDEIFEKLQRVGADYANFQKRVPKQVADAVAYEKEKIIKSLLPALDNFEHTLQNAHSAEHTDVLVKGVQIIHDQMLDILKSHGVEQIKARGEKFDPVLHEAMQRTSDPDQEEDTVLEEYQSGYRLNGRVIRPSKVIVNKPVSEDASTEQEQTSGESDPAETE